MTILRTHQPRPLKTALLGTALLAAALLSGCATYVDVETDPEGALITDQAGRTHGVSPVSIEYDRSSLEAEGGSVPGLIATWPSGARAETANPLIVTDLQYGLKVKMDRPKDAPGLEEDLRNAVKNANERARKAEAERDRMELYMDHGWGWGPGWGFGWGWRVP